VILLTVENILALHDEAIRRYGGDPGHYAETRAKIESIVAQQYPGFRVDRYPGVFNKAAMLLYFLAKGHCFVDGNKRTAIAAAITLLNLNGYRDMIPQHEGEMKVEAVAASIVPDEQRSRYISNLAISLRARFVKG